MNNIQCTENYDQFNDIASNREVDHKHVNKLVAAMRRKNLLHLNPLLVNNNMDVIDGQHRLEAAKILKVPVYYLINDEISKKDIAAINSNQKNWTVMDYINYWAVEKAPGFDKLCSFLSQHPMIPPSTALIMLSATGQRDLNGLKNGVVNLTNYDRACQIAEIIKEYRNIIDHAYDRNFILAVHHVVTTDGYDHSIMQAQLEFQSRSLVQCVNSKQYIELLQEIYNYRKSKNILKAI